MREEDRRRRADDGDDSELFRSEGQGATPMGKAIAGMTRHRSRIRDQPRRMIDEFRADAKLELNVKEGESWSYPDLARRVSWGHDQGLQRCFLLLANVVELLEQCSLFGVRLSRCRA